MHLGILLFLSSAGRRDSCGHSSVATPVTSLIQKAIPASLTLLQLAGLSSSGGSEASARLLSDLRFPLAAASLRSPRDADELQIGIRTLRSENRCSRSHFGEIVVDALAAMVTNSDSGEILSLSLYRRLWFRCNFNAAFFLHWSARIKVLPRQTCAF